MGTAPHTMVNEITHNLVVSMFSSIINEMNPALFKNKRIPRVEILGGL